MPSDRVRILSGRLYVLVVAMAATRQTIWWMNGTRHFTPLGPQFKSFHQTGASVRGWSITSENALIPLFPGNIREVRCLKATATKSDTQGYFSEFAHVALGFG